MIKKILQCALVGSVLLGSISASQAVNFANFAQTNSANGFTYVGVNPNPSTNGISTFTASGLAVQFFFQNALGGVKNGYNISVNTGTSYAAVLNFTGTASLGDAFPPFGINNFDTTSLKFFAANTAANVSAGLYNPMTNTGALLLAETSGAPGGGFGGTLNAPPGAFSSSFNASNPFDNVLFSSDVIKINNLTQQATALSFTNVVSPGTVNPGNVYDSTGNITFLTNFTANGTGTFSASSFTTQNTPEPGLLAVVGAMFVGGAFGLRRRRK